MKRLPGIDPEDYSWDATSYPDRWYTAAGEYACHNCSEDIAKGQRYFRVYGSLGDPSAGKFCSERCAGQFALRGV